MLLSFGTPGAVAHINGGAGNSELTGIAKFYPMPEGTLLAVRVTGLPASETGFFAFHIHEGTDCGGEGFADTKGHFNPGNLPHPRHAGDLPPLLSDNGAAELAVLSGRFRIPDIIGRTLVIHAGPDDFHTQPAGNSGAKIACGVIRQFP